jgi:fructose-1,6-bisphosphatase/sedoheptulose 1,7-bisphosphatase-like protein
MGWYKKVVLFDNLARDSALGYTATGITACGFLTAGNLVTRCDEIKQDVYFIESQSEFHRNGKFR